jgi:Na+/citrate or Na+/malate symporter
LLKVPEHDLGRWSDKYSNNIFIKSFYYIYILILSYRFVSVFTIIIASLFYDLYKKWTKYSAEKQITYFIFSVKEFHQNNNNKNNEKWWFKSYDLKIIL